MIAILMGCEDFFGIFLSCHPRENGDPGIMDYHKTNFLDSRLHGNDKIIIFLFFNHYTIMQNLCKMLKLAYDCPSPATHQIAKKPGSFYLSRAFGFN
ncbi:hypothetical protein COU23_03180 [Candidatus Kuenenbacteria bacterium CG10_big_fil_rev_8_21_14_0_10_36_11]|uniref:Uncharacterized protein n=1 Tax=Candidatus Kuenenbacteria bacterium CG10_big_fil_rev_8_21_14_0_10_36_11 TaxID=1974618 RepID=A0A2M6W9V9_9BACT|nr:MAG: hypothetical protein COU23_03180 [Candidatus Kuenenbacteria bacterium CG10_big_fil_rev_8_21_14_0_10_36_11]